MKYRNRKFHDKVVNLRMKNPCMTLQSMGDIFGLTRERIRQILKSENKPTVHLRQHFICTVCGIEFLKRKGDCNNAFCSAECYHRWTKENEKIIIPCFHCGKLIERNYREVKHVLKRGYKQFFCNRSCLAKNMVKQKKINDEKGYHPYAKENTFSIRSSQTQLTISKMQ
jgi:hypothetical protein